MFRLFFLPLCSYFVVQFVQARIQIKGADISSLLKLEATGQTFKDTTGNIRPLEVILHQAGVTVIRQRVWVQPQNGVYGLDYNLKLAKRIKAAGMETYLDLHLSDHWTDPAHQKIPVTWTQTSIDDLCATVYTYTQTVSNTFARANIYPIIISIGNEIENGLLWPLGITSEPWNIARLLHSASAGIRSSALSSRTKIMIHTSNGWDKSKQLWFYKSILSFGTFTLHDFDMIGFSIYPFQGPEATFSALKDTLEAFENKYPGKELVIAETNWPVSCPKPRSAFPSEAKQIPFSPKGQIEWVKQIANLLDSVKGGAGIFYWEPAWTANAGLGSGCDDNLLFDHTGKARDSVDMFSLV